MSEALAELETFLSNWQDTPECTREAFVRLKDFVAKKPGVVLEFHPRQGLTYSLRVRHEQQTDKPLFVMVDVIEDRPRWLSVCFFGDLITDPRELGDFVPEGLLGADAVCFDVNALDETLLNYVQDRIEEAHTAAAGG